MDLSTPARRLVIQMPTAQLDARVARSEALAGAVFRDRALARLWARNLAACRVIAAKLGEPSLTPAAIARAVGVSSRTLARGEAVMRRVFDERIARAARALASPQHARRSITEIAFACGFNDLSQLFARKVGTTPSQWRRSAR